MDVDKCICIFKKPIYKTLLSRHNNTAYDLCKTGGVVAQYNTEYMHRAYPGRRPGSFGVLCPVALPSAFIFH